MIPCFCAKKILLIGCGFHAVRIHIPTIEKIATRYTDLKIYLIDTDEKRLNKISKKIEIDIKPILVDPDIEIAIKIINKVCKLTKDDSVSVIISTPPDKREHYYNWALKSGFNILADKPLTYIKDASSKSKVSNDFFKNILKIEKSFDDNSNSLFECLSQRRNSPFYKTMRLSLEQLWDLTHAPITSININYGDGQLRTSDEHANIEYHGFNFGGGMLSHSAYHFIDMICFLSSGLIAIPDRIECYCASLRPDAFESNIINNANENSINVAFNENRLIPKISGELDVFITFSFIKKGVKFFVATLQMLHSSRSLRYWHSPSKNLYKGNGRIRHEIVTIHQYGVQSLNYVNMQSFSGNQFVVGTIPNLDDNASLCINRNPEFMNIACPKNEVLSTNKNDDLTTLYIGKGNQELSRVISIEDFFKRSFSKTRNVSTLSIKKQFFSHKLMAAACLACARENEGVTGISVLELNDKADKLL